MHEEASQTPVDPSKLLQRAVLLALLGCQSGQKLSRRQLADDLEADVGAVGSALQLLSDAGAVSVEGDQAWASASARLIDELGLIAI